VNAGRGHSFAKSSGSPLAVVPDYSLHLIAPNDLGKPATVVDLTK
jgi:hypothetical protein